MEEKQPFTGPERRREHKTLLELLGELVLLASWWPTVLALPLPMHSRAVQHKGRRRRDRGGRRATDRHVLGLEQPVAVAEPEQPGPALGTSCGRGLSYRVADRPRQHVLPRVRHRRRYKEKHHSGR